MPTSWRTRLVLACFLLLSIVAIAQTDRGNIAGEVKDSTGAVVPGAKVIVTNIQTNTSASAATNESGSFGFPNLAVGSYRIRVEREGFRPAVVTDIVLNGGATVRQDISLEVGAQTQAVEVTATAVQLTTDSARFATVITDKLVEDLPTVVGGALRSPFDLAIIAPESKNFGDNNFALGGGQAAAYNVNLDGVTANTTRALSNSWVATNTPSLDAITEFTVETNGFKAEYGHAGGGSINFVSKSGTNTLHGNAYEFVRNDAFDARRFFDKPGQKQIYKQHDFGATVGGPVWIPKLYKGKDKTFFFFSYEAFRNRNGATSGSSTVPTPEMYNGDFSKWVDKSGNVIPIYNPFSLRTDPATGKPVRDVFVGNIIPKNLFDPVSLQALAAFQSGPSGILKPNVNAAPGTIDYVRNNYLITAGSVVQPQTKYSLKVDHTFNERNRISGYIGWNRGAEEPGPNGPSTLPGFYSNYNDLQQNSNVYRLSYDHNFSPTLLNHFYAGGNNWAQNHDPIQATVKSGIDWTSKVCLKGAPDCSQNLVNLAFTDYTGWGGAANNGSENAVFAFNDDLTKIAGNHTIKFGAMYQRNHYNGFGRQNVAGQASFETIGTGPAGDTNSANGGNGFASFLLGWATNGGIDTVRYISQQWPYWAGYIQDDWRITPKLTINYGMRWETTLPPVEAENKWSDFSPTTPNPGADGRLGALIYAGTGDGRQGSRALADSWFWGFGPRLGVAYNWNDKAVIRANFARSFSAVTTTTGSTHQKGFTQTTSFPTGSPTQPSFLMKDGLPPYPVPPFISPSFQNGSDMPWWQGREVTRLPENIAFNLSIQHQLTPSLVLDLSYNALIGTHLQAGILNYNQVDPAYLAKYGADLLNSRIDSPQAIAAGFQPPFSNFVKLFGSRATVAQALRPYPQYTDINTWDGNGDHSGHSTYHAGIVKIEKRYSAGLTFTSSYVFSKILTDADSYWITDQARAADQYNRSLEKSIGSYDTTHNFKLGFSYELPFGKGKQFLGNGGPVTWLVGGWRVSSINTYASGRPLALSTTVGPPLFNGRKVPWITTYDNWQPAFTNGSFDPQLDRTIQPASFFPAQPNNTIGNATRFNPKFREFPAKNENVSLQKVFMIKERFNAELRGEAFNLLNRHRFNMGSLSLQDPNFGRVLNNSNLINSPRRLQVGLKLQF